MHIIFRVHGEIETQIEMSGSDVLYLLVYYKKQNLGEMIQLKNR